MLHKKIHFVPRFGFETGLRPMKPINYSCGLGFSQADGGYVGAQQVAPHRHQLKASSTRSPIEIGGYGYEVRLRGLET